MDSIAAEPCCFKMHPFFSSQAALLHQSVPRELGVANAASDATLLFGLGISERASEFRDEGGELCHKMYDLPKCS